MWVLITRHMYFLFDNTRLKWHCIQCTKSFFTVRFKYIYQFHRFEKYNNFIA